jgi:hypothetical protein
MICLELLEDAPEARNCLLTKDAICLTQHCLKNLLNKLLPLFAAFETFYHAAFHKKRIYAWFIILDRLIFPFFIFKENKDSQ